jgi:hypothetical protein
VATFEKLYFVVAIINEEDWMIYSAPPIRTNQIALAPGKCVLAPYQIERKPIQRYFIPAVTEGGLLAPSAMKFILSAGCSLPRNA